MKKILIFSLMVVILLIAGCGPTCPSCPAASSYSECNDDAMKTRTNYQCSESTNFECKSSVEEKQCATEIKLQAAVGTMDAAVRPSVEENVKGIVKVEVTSVPVGTQLVAVGFGGGDLPPLGEGSAYTFATEADGVWTIIVDTTEYGNGVYSVGVAASPDGNSPPSAFAQGQMIISN